ncbi:hypothetical protein PQC38_gp033 [Aeromonas phage BUCT695]|uniref:hypothetical protein n=1 Tax=Aeromonas phage BUCT695 TaxID=2908630 RepID=UPI0023298B06|nr:hypothetical protein PQC38_gp033 [Aeromonas phage BUCT695]UIW10509.1 hypothetical protein [Aeromonas phage BUCT695]
MKKIALIGVAACAALLSACGGEDLTAEQKFELRKMEIQKQQAVEVARANQQPVTYQRSQEYTVDERDPVYVPQAEPQSYSSGVNAQYNQGGGYSSNTAPSESGSSVMGTVGTLAAGALAGYVASELLDDGYRKYSDDRGRPFYVDNRGVKISQSQYLNHKKTHPVKSKLSDYNQKGKSVINKASTTVSKTAVAAKDKGVYHWGQAKQKAEAVKPKAKSFFSKSKDKAKSFSFKPKRRRLHS